MEVSTPVHGLGDNHGTGWEGQSSWWQAESPTRSRLAVRQSHLHLSSSQSTPSPCHTCTGKHLEQQTNQRTGMEATGGGAYFKVRLRINYVPIFKVR